MRRDFLHIISGVSHGTISDAEKVAMFRSIVAEMSQFFVGSGLSCQRDGDHFEVHQPKKRKSWRLLVTDTDARTALQDSRAANLDAFLSLCEIPPDVRDYLGSRNIMWIDIAKKEQTRVSNDLGEEVSLFLKRYGVRTARCPRLPD